MSREELQRLYGECVSRAFRAEQLAGLVRGVESFLAEPDPTVEIASQYGVSQRTILRVLQRKVFRHVA